MNEIIRRLNDAHTEWSKHLDINGSPSFGVWLLNRAESAEARAESLNNENMDLRAEKAQAEKSFNDALADLKAMMQERDELRRQLEQAQARIVELETRTDNAAEHIDIDRGTEWEVEYYLRRMRR